MEEQQYLTKKPFIDDVQTPLETPTQSPLETPTQSPLETTTQNPLETPTQSPLEILTQEPTLVPIIYNESDFENKNRLKYNLETLMMTKKTEKSAVIFIINVSRFENYSEKTEDGGVIYIHNYGIDIQKIEFVSCQSDSGGGGAIYIKNENTLNNKVSFDNLYFNECKAVYGGAFYIYSSNKESQVSFSKCTFKSNQATKQDSKDDPLSGESSN